MITVKRDPQIELPKIITGLMETPRPYEGVNEYNTSGVDQTEVYGVLCPLLSLNGVVVDMPNLIRFELDCTGMLPRVEFVFRDRNNLFAQYNLPSLNNSLQIQIIPPVDATYHKINMTFYVTDISYSNGIVSGEGTYEVKGLLTDKAHSMGELTTYELCDKISVESKLGFASNVAGTDDKRFIYCDYKDYGNLLKEEISRSAADDLHVYDCWVDMWNYIVLCDVLERYTHLDTEEEMTIWVADHNTIGGINDKAEPARIQCVLSNHPAMERNELFVRMYEVITDNQYVRHGTKKSVAVYNMNTNQYMKHYVSDGDVNNVESSVSLEYGGEVYGDYDYIFSKQCRNMFLKKMKSEIIEVTLTSPIFGLSRGDQCRFVWLDNDPRNKYWRETLEQNNATSTISDIDAKDMNWLNGWVSSVKGVQDDSLYINLQVSGQYTVLGILADYENGNWLYKIQLVRPASRKPKLMVDINANIEK